MTWGSRTSRHHIGHDIGRGQWITAMLEDPTLSYDPGYAAGATLRRASEIHTETMCEQGLALRLESWAEAHFARQSAGNITAQHRQSSREHFRRGFRDGYWARARRRDAALEMVA